MGTETVQEGAATIDADIPCLSCGYNLRGLAEDGRCPECGTAIEPSVQRYRLRGRQRWRRRARAAVAHADRALRRLFGVWGRRLPEMPLDLAENGWRREMREAAWLLAVATLWPLVGFPISLGVLLAGSGRIEGRDGFHAAFGQELAVRAGYLACYCLPWVLAGWAMWKAGRREYVRPGYRRDSAEFRWGLRITAVVWLATPALINPPWEYYANEGFYPLLALAGPLSVLFCGRMAAVARRAGRPRLGGHCSVVGWIACVAIALQFLLGLLVLSGRSRWWADEVFAVSPLPGGGLLWFAMWLVPAVARKADASAVSAGVAILFLLGLATWSCVTLLRVARVTRVQR